MRGLFAEWQPRYANVGVPTFPVHIRGSQKKPAVKGYLKTDLRVSDLLAERFGDAVAFGFPCGPLSRITVIDIDSSDEAVLFETTKLVGEPLVIWQTGGGNFALPFRHNGEGRHIRPILGLPVDLLGGGYAVAPPSRGVSQNYEFLRGSLSDFDRLPVARLDKLLLPDPAKRVDVRIREGTRDETLFRKALEEAGHVDSFDDLLDVLRTRNLDCEPPLPDAVLVSKARSAWRYQEEGRNLVGQGRAVITRHAEIDLLAAKHPEAFALLIILKRHHWGRNFVIANAMSEELGWTLDRFRKARAKLIAFGLVEEVEAVKRHAPALYRFRVSDSIHQ